MLEDWFTFGESIDTSTKDSRKTPTFAPLPQEQANDNICVGEDLFTIGSFNMDSKGLNELDFQGLKNTDNLSTNSDNWLI